MADAETSGRICTAIMKLVELESAAKDRITATKKEAEDFARAHARAARLASATESAAATFIADLNSRRKGLAALLAREPDHDNESVLEDLLKIPGTFLLRLP